MEAVVLVEAKNLVCLSSVLLGELGTKSFEVEGWLSLERIHFLLLSFVSWPFSFTLFFLPFVH